MTGESTTGNGHARAAVAWRLIRTVMVALAAAELLSGASGRFSSEDVVRDRQLGGLLLLVTVLDIVVWFVVDRRKPDDTDAGRGE